MPLPQVTDRIKEIPGQALRVAFGGIGQLLMAADKVRARLAEQLTGAGEPVGDDRAERGGAVSAPQRPAGPPAGESAAEVTSATVPPAPVASGTVQPGTVQPGTVQPGTMQPGAPDAATAEPGAPGTRQVKPGAARWRSLDKTGNVRLLGEEDTGTGAGPAAPAASAGPAVTTPQDAAAPEPGTAPEPSATAEAASPAGTGEAAPGTAIAEPAPAELEQRPPAVVAEPAPATLAGPAPAAVAGSEAAGSEAAGSEAAALPVAGYDGLSVASLRARLRFLDSAGVRTLLEYEKAHQDRAAVITMFERRITKLGEGS